MNFKSQNNFPKAENIGPQIPSLVGEGYKLTAYGDILWETHRNTYYWNGKFSAASYEITT